jgi:hypothetical protein
MCFHAVCRRRCISACRAAPAPACCAGCAPRPERHQPRRRATPLCPPLRRQVPLQATQQATLSVAVRVRPLLKTEEARQRKDIVRVVDGKVVVVLDPDASKARKRRRRAWARPEQQLNQQGLGAKCRVGGGV